MATNIYVDGLNFCYGAVKGTPYKWLDYEALGKLLLPHDALGRVKYVTAHVQDRYPGDRSGERQNVYIRALRANPNIDVKMGHFRSDATWRALADSEHVHSELFSPHFRPRRAFTWMWKDKVRRRTEPFSSARVLIREEKGSDVNLGVHLVFDALKGNCTKALVLSNDADLAEAISLARTGGIEVGFLNPHRGASNRRLQKVASFQVPFRREVLERCLLPRTVRDAKGRQLHCPREWR